MYYWTRILSTGGIVGCADGHLSNYFFYRPGLSTGTNLTPVLVWARESEELASVMCAAIRAAPQLIHGRAEVERVRAKFLAITTGNQFGWNALRGASRIELARSFFRLAGILFGEATGPRRALRALLLARTILEQRILAEARQLAAAAKRKGEGF